MYVFSDDNSIVDLSKFAAVMIAKDNCVVATNLDESAVRLGKFENEEEARLKVQEIMTALEHKRDTFYIGEFSMPF
jgi:hypothetical protein